MSQQSPPLRVLIVEDNEDTKALLKRYLARLGYTIFVAGTVSSGLQTMRSQEIDVLISDIGLPDGNGWEMVESASKALPSYAIAMSGFGSLKDQEKSARLGFRHHLIKPFQLDELKLMLREAEDARPRG